MHSVERPLRKSFQDLDFGTKSCLDNTARVAKLRTLSEHIGKSMAAKFKTVRDCFRFIDEDHNGGVSREELQRLLRQFNYDEKFADEFFDLLDSNGSEEIDFNDLRAFIGPHIQPGFQAPLRTPRKGPTSVSEIHEMNHDTNIQRHRTTYADMVQGCGGKQSGLMPGYGGSTTPRLHNERFLEARDYNSDRDVLPALKEFRQGLPNRFSARKESESSICTFTSKASKGTVTSNVNNSTKLLVPYTDGSVLRRLNQAALIAGSVVGQSYGVPRRASA